MSKTCFVMFVVGAAAGSAATWLYTKKYYERIAQEENRFGESRIL